MIAPAAAADDRRSAYAETWDVMPVFRQGDGSRLQGGVLWPAHARQLPFALVDLEPAEALDQAAEATTLALTLLERLPDAIWMAVPIHSRALLSPRGWWRQLSRCLPDLAACRELAGRRLVFAVMQAEALQAGPHELLRNLAEQHTLALAVDQLAPALLRDPLGWPISQLFFGVRACVGIDADQALQQQWRFTARAACALDLSVAILGVQSHSELAWLRRHGCDAMGGPLLARPLSASAFLASAAA